VRQGYIALSCNILRNCRLQGQTLLWQLPHYANISVVRKGVLWQHFHDRSWVYHSVYRIYSRSFVSLRSSDSQYGIWNLCSKHVSLLMIYWFSGRHVSG
jgi:hypothetical protein